MSVVEKKLLLMSHKMNLGGTEKALLSFLYALEGKNVDVTLLLLEPGGVLFDAIPNWVHVKFIEDFKMLKTIIFNPPQQLIKSQIRNFDLRDGIKTLIRYLKVKVTGNWYYNYIASLEQYKTLYHADIAVAFAGPSDFISYFLLEKVVARNKYQWIHFDVEKVIFSPAFGNKFYPKFDRIFCVSENAKSSFDKMFPRLNEKSQVFKNIISHHRIEEEASRGNTFNDDFEGLRILTVGRLSREKGQDMIVPVVKRLIEDGISFRWYVIGDGKLTKSMQDQIKEYELQGNLILLGAITNPYAYLRDCDIYVQTSRHEGYCITVHEAKVFNKPIVTTNFLSAPNLVKDKEDGLIVEISVDALYEATKKMILDNEFRERCSRALLAKDTSSEIDKIF